MNDKKNLETQQELFTSFAADSEQMPEAAIARQARIRKPILLTTSVEQIVFLGIISILIISTVFFLGILRGKSLDELSPGKVYKAAREAYPQAQEGSSFSSQVDQSNQVAVEFNSKTLKSSTTESLLNQNKEKLSGADTPSVGVGASVADKLISQIGLKGDSKPYTIQLATYKKRDMAEAEVNKLKSQGYDAFVRPSGIYYLACCGRFANMAEASKDLQVLGSRYKDRYLRRI